MTPNASEVLQLMPEARRATPRVPVLACLSAAMLITGAFGMAVSVLVFAGGPNFAHVLAGGAGFIGCAVLVTSGAIALSIGGRRSASGMDVPAAVAYVVLAGGVLIMAASSVVIASESPVVRGAEPWLVQACVGGGGFIAGAVLAAGGLIGAAFRARNG